MNTDFNLNNALTALADTGRFTFVDNFPAEFSDAIRFAINENGASVYFKTSSNYQTTAYLRPLETKDRWTQEMINFYYWGDELDVEDVQRWAEAA